MTELRRHAIDLDNFSATEIEEILETAESMREVLSREIKQVPALRGKTVVNMFFEESTRTRISFELAARALSANVVAFTARGSSVEKGESLVDTVRTLQALGADIIVMRHSRVRLIWWRVTFVARLSMPAMAAMPILRRHCSISIRCRVDWDKSAICTSLLSAIFCIAGWCAPTCGA